ncbi:UNVERIFIED_ORG: hypothetical protein J2W85_002404 [Ensifer adhaerens]|nr:hypothetical protein [Ensifer adhaerens]
MEGNRKSTAANGAKLQRAVVRSRPQADVNAAPTNPRWEKARSRGEVYRLPTLALSFASGRNSALPTRRSALSKHFRIASSMLFARSLSHTSSPKTSQACLMRCLNSPSVMGTVMLLRDIPEVLSSLSYTTGTATKLRRRDSPTALEILTSRPFLLGVVTEHPVGTLIPMTVPTMLKSSPPPDFC